MCTFCTIVPDAVLKKLSKDKALSAEARRGLSQTIRLDTEIRKLRRQASKLTALEFAPKIAIAPRPEKTVYNCDHSQTLPGMPIANPPASRDATVTTVFSTTGKVAEFFEQVFARNSIDDAGMTLMSSVHFGTDYTNAFWNGLQMAYGDGDGRVFVDFSRSTDVIGHELTHGVTQHALGLGYTNEPGGLNESLSDVFGSMFRQWDAGQTAEEADWLIGHDIMGPEALRRGFTCLRDMSDPGGQHCLSEQPGHYSGYQPGMDPHFSSGIPNRAFYLAAKAIGGPSWEKAGRVWYAALTFGRAPGMKMKRFADLTRRLAGTTFPDEPNVGAAIDAAWTTVGL